MTLEQPTIPTVINASAASEYEQRKAKFARDRALILKILNKYPRLTTQEIVYYEMKLFNETFLTDNRLRELRELGWVANTTDSPMRWYVVPIEETPTAMHNEEPQKDFDVDESNQDQEADYTESEEY